MKIIGLTGPSGSGKTTVCSIFTELGIPCIDTDSVYHSIVSSPSPCNDELRAHFGDQIIDKDGSLNRPALASLVFAEDNTGAELTALNSITHKYIWERTNEILTEYMRQGKEAAVIDAPALLSSNVFLGRCDLIISIISDRTLRLQRIIKRDGISAEQAEQRLNAQPCDEFFIDNSDFYINNSSTTDDLRRHLISILEQEEIVHR